MATTQRRIAPKNTERKLTAIKLLPEEIKEIDRRAKKLGLTRTDFMVRKSLDRPVGDENHDDQLADLDRRLTLVERATFGG